MKTCGAVLGFALGLMTTSLAMAEEGPGAEDRPRFRFGVAAGAGPLIARGGGQATTLFYGGVDLRFGVQVNDLLAIYAQPQLGLYGGDSGGRSGFGGLAGASVLGEVTLSEQFFVGAGVGYAVLHSPAGPELHFRGGLYPAMQRAEGRARRKGFMLGVDFRIHMVSGGVTGIAPTFNIGYEAF
jgi:hypothetical protein